MEGSGPSSSSDPVGCTAYALASFLPLGENKNAELELDIELENECEAMGDWCEDGVEAALENVLCYPHLRRRGKGRTGSRAGVARGRGKCKEGTGGG